MFGLDAAIIASIIVALLSGGVLVSFIEWLRNRKKDDATAKLTDVQTLQAKLAYMESIHESLQKHNDNLQKDYDELEERHRAVRKRVTELEEELDRVRRSAAQTQAECEALGRKLQEVLGEG